jgi:HEAT repeat protein
MTWQPSDPGFGEFLDQQSNESVLTELGRTTDPELLEVLAHEAGHRGIRESATLLIELARNDARERVKAAAIESLWQLNYRQAGPVILSLFHDRTQPKAVRDSAAYALGRLEYLPALSALREARGREQGTIADCVAGAIDVIQGANRTAATSGITQAAAAVGQPRRFEGRLA